MFQTVISCSFLVKVVNKASLTTVLDLQFVSWKLSLIPSPMLWRITSQSLRASKFQLVRVKQTATNAPVIERMNHMANVSMSTANASFRNGILVHLTFKGMFKCCSVYQPSLRIKMTWLYWIFVLDFWFRIENGFPEIFPSKASIARDWQLTCCVISVNYNQNPLPITGINEFCRCL